MKIKKVIKDLNKRCKKVTVSDISLIKLSAATGIIIVLKLWPAALKWVLDTNIWWFVLALVIFMLKPMKKFYG
jgi:hypothetical protein